MEETIFCLARKTRVAALPEEMVRQRILLHMTTQKEFPASLITVEQPLRRLPHLSLVDPKHIPNRRADILCFSKGSLDPLLLIECKAVKLTSAVMRQTIGYHYFVRSPFIAIANQEEIRFGWYDAEKKDYVFIHYLPSYPKLLQHYQEKVSITSPSEVTA